MRVVVIGATGNVGTSVVEALRHEPRVGEIVGLSRRPPQLRRGKVGWVQADGTTAELGRVLGGPAGVVPLAGATQPSRDEETMERINVKGTHRVLGAVLA